jgi:hypothetical protein
VFFEERAYSLNQYVREPASETIERAGGRPVQAVHGGITIKSMSAASAAHVSHFTGIAGTPSSVGTLLMGSVVPGASSPAAIADAGLPSDHMARLAQEAYVAGLATLGWTLGGAVAGHPGEIAGGLGAAAFAYRRAKRP